MADEVEAEDRREREWRQAHRDYSRLCWATGTAWTLKGFYALNPHLVDKTVRVYFISAVDGPIKIGRSKDPVGRLKAMQTGSGARLVLLGTKVGGVAEEQAVQDHFAHLRLHGEWFKDTPELRAWIVENCTLGSGSLVARCLSS